MASLDPLKTIVVVNDTPELKKELTWKGVAEDIVSNQNDNFDVVVDDRERADDEVAKVHFMNDDLMPEDNPMMVRDSIEIEYIKMQSIKNLALEKK